MNVHSSGFISRAVVSLALLAASVLLPFTPPASAQAANPAGQTLPEPVRQALTKAGLSESHLAVAVLPLHPAARSGASHGRGRAAAPALLHQPDRPMQPASAMKVLTSAVGLDRLGPNGRGYTELRTAAPVVDGRLQGDLILVGGADLELGLPQLWALMLELREAGVRHIDGDIVLDRHLFSPARMDLGLPPFDESPEFPYNVIPDALQLAGNLHVLELQSDRQGVSARLRPELPGVRVDNRLTLHEPGAVSCREWSTRGWLPPVAEVQPDGVVRIELRGRFPVDCQHRQPLQLMERNLQAHAQLRWVWQELGGQWSGRVREAVASTVAPQAAPTRLIARREARPWGEWLRPLNKTSDNVATRILFLLVGLEEERRAAARGAAVPGRTTREWADASVRRWFAERGIASEGLVMDNGSGLSRSERITARQLALVLREAHDHLYAPELVMSLPIAGVDGSLRNRMTESPARARARLKPGTLRNAVALAGYVEDAQGRRWAMAAMVNHEEAPQRGRPVLDALAGWVAAGMP
jgi:D-alanyl-D-alanine carboxypeptidase/D-alanyl-D-alanine-endopeptidase (penicillin-binding protein 4)